MMVNMIVLARRIDQSHRNGRQTERFPISSSSEDYIFHPAAAQSLSRLLAEHPANGVAEIGLSTTVGADDSGDARTVELHLGSFNEGLKALNFNPLEFQQYSVPFLTLSPRGMVLW
jgi:hypothetical protein